MIKKLLYLFMLLAAGSVSAQLPAFPGAEGWGAASVGGRGGAVIEVTNLNDDGPGSFRKAVEATGPRTIVFRTGGVIDLLTEVQITNPYIYIAGQTAPGDGIVLKNFPIAIFTHDVTIRGLRIRAGDDFPQYGPDNRDCISIQPPSYNVIIDHCSFSWGSDENVSILGAGVNSVTVQWCMIAEGLYASIHPKGAHSMGLLVGYDAEKTSIHHNLFAHNGGRNPVFLRQGDHEFVNNVVYDWMYKTELLQQDTFVKVDFIGNYFKPYSNNPFPELPIGIDFDSATSRGSKLYMVNNFFSAGEYFITPQQLATFGGNAVLFSSSSLLSVPSTITQKSPFEARDTVLLGAGALHPQRDATDLRVLKSVNDSIGGMLDCINPVILLDSGNVVGATDSTLIYSQFGKPFYYSTESRRIEITSGKGAGQVRYGIPGIAVLDTQKIILEGRLNAPWNVIPDSTSTYKFYAGCNNSLGSYPSYNIGVAPVDTDHDGMPDNWETNHGLNPNDSADRNGTNLDGRGYTNLEFYLNGFYLNTNTGIKENSSKYLQVSPNPFNYLTTITLAEPFAGSRLALFNIYGQKVKDIENISNSEIILRRDNLPAGMYLLHMTQNNVLKSSIKLLIAE